MLMHDLSNPGMRVDDIGAVRRNGEMVLATAKRDQQHVVRLNGPRRRHKARSRRKMQPLIDRQITQAIAGRCQGPRAGRCEGGHH